MTFSPTNIFDWRDHQYHTPTGTLTFRLYATGWLVRHSLAAGGMEKIEDADIWTACRFANDRI